MTPLAADPLPWSELADIDAVYVTACDLPALRLARSARIVVATARIAPLLRAAGVTLDALVGSARDPSEPYTVGDIEPDDSGGQLDMGGLLVRIVQLQELNAFASGHLDPEIADSIELGIKTDLMDDRLRINAVVYNVKYKDAQRELVDLDLFEPIVGAQPRNLIDQRSRERTHFIRAHRSELIDRVHVRDRATTRSLGTSRRSRT